MITPFDIQKSRVDFALGKISNSNLIEKSKKSVPIGTISQGYKKIAEGKWRKVSQFGLTQVEHEKKFNEHSDAANELHPHVGGVGSNHNELMSKRDYHMKERNKHQSQLSQVNSKDYTDEDVKSELISFINSQKDLIYRLQSTDGKNSVASKAAQKKIKEAQEKLKDL